MKEIFAYHVVTDRPMHVGQYIVFDGARHNGVYDRVMEKLPLVEDIYQRPDEYNAEELEHHTRVALRELALEKVRKESFSGFPSRMSCLYVSESLEEAEMWAGLFVEWKRPVYAIVRLKIAGRVFTGDANNCFDATVNEAENLLLAERYWKNEPNLTGEPVIREMLVDGDIEVAEIVREISCMESGGSKNDY